MSNYNFADVNNDQAAASSSSCAGRGIVHIEEHAQQALNQAQRAQEYASAAASDFDSSSGGESSNVNFMAQRPSFQVQLPFSEKFADRAPYGSGDFDDGYTLEFDSIDHFMEWRTKVEEEDTVEFVKGDSHGSKADPPRFKEHVKLVCARHNRSGRKTYVKKYPERQRKVPSRKVRPIVLNFASESIWTLILLFLFSSAAKGVLHLLVTRHIIIRRGFERCVGSTPRCIGGIS